MSEELKHKYLNDEWIVWKHDINNGNWKIEGFDVLYEIKSIYDFWCFFNNLGKINFKDSYIYVMRKGVLPIWEDKNNRNGGTCSIRIDNDKISYYFTELMMYIVNEYLINNDDYSEINGVSILTKGNWTFIKILNRNRDINPIDLMNKDIKNNYLELSIKYKPNTPEY